MSDPLLQVLERIADSLEELLKQSPRPSPGESNHLAGRPQAPANLVLPMKILQYLITQKVEVRCLRQPFEHDPSLDAISFVIGQNYRLFRPWLQATSAAIDAEQPQVRVHVDSSNATLLGSVLTLLKSVGYVSSYQHSPIQKVLSFEVYRTDACGAFILREWMERYCRSAIRQFLNLDSLPVEILSDVEITDTAGSQLKLDTLLMVGDQLYYWDAEARPLTPEELEERTQILTCLGLTESQAFFVLPQSPKQWETVPGFTILTLDGMLNKIEEIEQTHGEQQ